MSLKPLVNNTFPAPVWRMEIDELSETLFLETRNDADRQVSFAAVSLQTGELLFKDNTAPERWLTGIEASYDGVLLLHFYQNETGPTHKGLMAIDGKTGLQLWTNFALALDYLSEEGPVVFDLSVQPRKYFLLDVKNGATTRVDLPSVLKGIKNDIRVPEVRDNDELTQGLNFKHTFGNSLHYMEHNNFRIVSLHALKGGGLIQMLYVFEGEKLIYEDIINSGIQKMQPESFILHKNRLIYLKNRSELKVLTLHDTSN